MRPTVKVSARDDSAKLKAELRKLQKVDVLVGWPEDTSHRKESTQITNPQLAFVHSHGSPLQNIPARPILQPAIEAPDNKALITEELKRAAQSALSAEPTEATAHLNRAGLAAANAAKSWFTDARNQWAPNRPATIARKGSDKPLIDTGQLRRSVSFVVKDT